MSICVIKLLSEEKMSDFYGFGQISLAKDLLNEGYYRSVCAIDLPEFDSESAAEECFDIANNPRRDGCRSDLYGNHRSLSVGDIVEVNGSCWLCLSVGWVNI